MGMEMGRGRGGVRGLAEGDVGGWMDGLSLD